MFSKRFWVLVAAVVVLTTALTNSPAAPSQALFGRIVPCLVCLPARTLILPDRWLQPQAGRSSSPVEQPPSRDAGRPSGWEGVIAPTDWFTTPTSTPSVTPKPPRDDRSS